jgi:hypothetical protein
VSLTDTSPAVAPPEPARWHVSARCLWLALVLGWVAMVVVALVAGARPATFNDLERAVAAGQVDEVWVEGGLGPSGRGFAVATVSWRYGPIEDTTQVLEARPRSLGWREGPHEDVTAVLDRSVTDELLAIGPDLLVHQAPFREDSVDLAGWRLPGWAVWLQLTLALATLATLICSPPPWRATRWAWFWLMASGPIGLATYLLLAGPLPYLRAPRPGGRRLTGGWAFLLAFGLASLAGW